MRTLQLELGKRSYPIYIGSGLLGQNDLLIPHIQGERVAIISNETVAPLYLDRFKQSLPGYDTISVILPDGEQYKTLEHVNKIFDVLLENRCDRHTTLIALGGGVVGDMTGFAAACYMRGVPFVQVPTTLLSQVDSSVGGKTGVNHRLGKNMIGAFYQPRCVLIDIDTLNTLPDNELSAGLAEVIKYGLIRDAEFFSWLERNITKLLVRDGELLIEAVYRSCQNKAEIVAQDETEAGVRALLNLGHTFGHAIEAGMGYGKWLHGEAVAAGMCAAGDLSQRQGWLSNSDTERIEKLLSAAHLPVRLPHELSYQRMLELMAVDKKVQRGKLRFVLLTAIGSAVITEDYDPRLLEETLEAMRALP